MSDNRFMASLLLITGPPGAGKSTVARAVARRRERSVVVDGDTFFAFLARGTISPWLPEADHQNEIVTRAGAAAAGRYVAGGYDTVFDGVVGPWFLPAFAAATGLEWLHYVILMPSLERCVSRVRTRRGHGFTDEAATRHMHEQFKRAMIDPRHVLVEPPDDVGDVADLVLAAVGKESLIYHCAPS